MGNHTVRRHQVAIRAYMAEHNVSYTAAARALSQAQQQDQATEAGDASPVIGPPDAFGGHEFEYQSVDDLFRCSFCKEYEVVVRAKDGTIAPCTGLVGYGGDTDRVYLLVTVFPEPTAWLARRIWDTGIARIPRFGGGDPWLVESAPSVVDDLVWQLSQVMVPSTPGGRDQVPAFTVIERLSAGEGLRVLADKYAAYVEEFGTPR